ncbi:hypothetical protein AJ78_07063 [Emergomyces pasteurianus Ep9510]|uniref:Uncharacterized protein n=1 Tax=Emergomyces pasteurianus Ep9510 TaxID=1447872 RepID=A0A1J9PWR5_9EURO|nr:hypothetical protein AJ78_07063 [Emergomyces pasteurianus Ep9510]
MAKRESSLPDLGDTQVTASPVVDGTALSRSSYGICSGKADLDTSAALQEHPENSHFDHESCCWFTKSSALQGQHTELVHHRMCADRATIVSNGRGICSPPIKQSFSKIKCYCCDATFTSVSSMFYHLEHEACPSGINRQDIEKLTTWYLYYLQYQGVFLYYCGRCRRPFQSMFDLLRHAEDIPCLRLGLYSRGSLIDYIASNIESLVKYPIQSVDPDDAQKTMVPTDGITVEEHIINQDTDRIREDTASGITNKDIMLVPSIVITRIDGSTIKG